MGGLLELILLVQQLRCFPLRSLIDLGGTGGFTNAYTDFGAPCMHTVCRLDCSSGLFSGGEVHEEVAVVARLGACEVTFARDDDFADGVAGRC